MTFAWTTLSPGLLGLLVGSSPLVARVNLILSGSRDVCLAKPLVLLSDVKWVKIWTTRRYPNAMVENRQLIGIDLNSGLGDYQVREDITHSPQTKPLLLLRVSTLS